MKILTRIGLWLLELQPPPTPSSRVLRPGPTAEDAPAALDEPPGACGWFDSSHALVSGLRVRELANPEGLAELPLRSWLDLELGAIRRDDRPGSPARPG